MRILLVLLLSFMPIPATAQSEKDYIEMLCFGLNIEVRTPEGTRADCVSETHAIEVDFSKKWAEAIGQSLHYAEQLDRKAGVILVCKSPGLCFAHANRLRRIIDHNMINLTLWLCAADGKSLGECMRLEHAPAFVAVLN